MTENPQQPVVATRSGAVRGTWRDGAAAFLGIPFAEPPVGDLRFAAPVPHRPWSGVRPADRYGATPQRKPLAEVTLIPEPSIPGDSTLNVNVFTPSPVAANGAGLPVLVWIHGGGYVAGSPASPWYDGAAFNRDGVVTVTVSYRLGFDGFGWIQDAPRNRGVLDWLLALEWVKYNIAAFGGDPSKVTISGQSAGGGAVLTLLGCPRAQPLFNRVISLSGPPTGTTMAAAEALGRKLAELGGVAPTVAGLSALTEAEILALQGQVSTIGGGDGEADPIAGLAAMLGDGLTLGPVVDGDLIPMPTTEALAAGIGADKKLILGTTDNEFGMVLAGAGEALSGVPAAGVLGAVGAEPEVIDAYVADHPDLGTADLVGQYVTDHMFRAPALNLAELREGSQAPTWLYRFAWNSPTMGNACHCLDVPFMFDCLGAEHIAPLAGTDPPQALADEVHGSAVSFIATGDPGWPAWEDAARAVRVYGVPTTLVADGYADARALLPERAAR
ncbi:carboxylesterase/lipase family protein [Paeniglutamicibacter kerguelensis]|uniref:Carboxylic ester hydrolase n=1 Tax=Paeniglutamicibacter kerguelensis TaxID=254788 RepID=A0ABS4XC12_9MICC|nr:carboxylesterase family protein [Paeniglutamicibacter kerguelensis]MBP2386001.1 para-nitrobenzyl esterase [Paeniglutamicibacter kerguelensis]